MHSTNNLKDGYLGSGTYFRRSVKKYGKKNFKCDILEFLNNRTKLIEREKEIVNEDLVKDVLCMNLKTGGGSITASFQDKKHTAETKLKQRLSKLGNQHGKNNKNRLGIPHTQETKALMILGHKKSEELKDLERTEEQKSIRTEAKEIRLRKKKGTYFNLIKIKPKLMRLSREAAQKGNTNAKGSIRTKEVKKQKSIQMKGNKNAKGSVRTEAMRQVARENNLRVWAERKAKQNES
jgi:hypothetical protein